MSHLNLPDNSFCYFTFCIFSCYFKVSSPATLKYPSILSLTCVSQDFVLKFSELYNKTLVFFVLLFSSNVGKNSGISLQLCLLCCFSLPF